MATHRIELELTDLQVELLRRWIDEAPTNPYGPMIAAVLPHLPLDTDPAACDDYLFAVLQKSVAGTPSGPDRRPTLLQVPGDVGGVQLVAHTTKGRERLPDVLRNLLRTTLPHGESL